MRLWNSLRQEHIVFTYPRSRGDRISKLRYSHTHTTDPLAPVPGLIAAHHHKMGTGRGTCFKRITASVLAAAIIAIIVAVCVVYIPRDHSINDGPKVTNKEAFKNGGARKHPSKNDGKDDADDQYTYYPGDVSNYPKKDEWVSFNHMWKSNLLKMQTACTKLGFEENNSFVPSSSQTADVELTIDGQGRRKRLHQRWNSIRWQSFSRRPAIHPCHHHARIHWLPPGELYRQRARRPQPWHHAIPQRSLI